MHLHNPKQPLCSIMSSACCLAACLLPLVVSSLNLKKEINQLITDHIGPIAKLDKIQFVEGLPKTRSGKIMRRILRKIASKDTSNLGDTSTLLNPEIVESIMKESL